VVVKLLLIVNAAASSVTARTRVVIAKALASDHDLRVADTSQRGHATRLALEAAERGDDAVIVLGGDGTLNEAANGLAGTATALASVPGGSTNVFARAIGLPNDPVEATGVLLDALGRRSVRRVGLGAVNGRYFLFHLGVGFDAAVVEQVERRAPLKRMAGHPWFVWCALVTWMRNYDRSRPRFAVHVDGGRVIDDAYMALMLNSNPYSYLGQRPLDIAPDAGLDHPLAVLTLRSLGVVPVLNLAGRALVGGRAATRSRWVDYAPRQHQVTITGYGPIPHQMDGEYLGLASELTVTHHPDVLDVVVPLHQ
jgi:diacylglycerol kinase family enzyme